MSLFGAPSTPPPPSEIMPAPQITDPAIAESGEAERRAALLRRGRASTVSAGKEDLGLAAVQKKTLLGG